MQSSAAATADELPYNPANRLLTEEDLVRILSAYGVQLRPRDVGVYRKAFIHQSYCTRKNKNFVNGNEQCPEGCIPLQEESYERQEFLGDAILALVVANYLFTRYPGESPDFLTKMRTKLVNGHMLAHLAGCVGLTPFVLISRQIESREGREQRKDILEDTFESFIASMFLDFNTKEIKGKGAAFFSGLGYQVAETWIVNVLEAHVDFTELIRENRNYKDQLFRYYQHTFQSLPVLVDVESPGAKGQFGVCIKNDKGVVVGMGHGDTKKKAEQQAAHQALVYYGQLQ